MDEEGGKGERDRLKKAAGRTEREEGEGDRLKKAAGWTERKEEGERPP